MKIYLNEPRVAIVRAHPGIAAVQRKMDDMADICVLLVSPVRLIKLVIERNVATYNRTSNIIRGILQSGPSLYCLSYPCSNAYYLI